MVLVVSYLVLVVYITYHTLKVAIKGFNNVVYELENTELVLRHTQRNKLKVKQ